MPEKKTGKKAITKPEAKVESKPVAPVVSKPKPAVKRRKYRNVGSSRIEVGPNRFLAPGEETHTRPHRLDFYKQIGAIEEIEY